VSTIDAPRDTLDVVPESKIKTQTTPAMMTDRNEEEEDMDADMTAVENFSAAIQRGNPLFYNRHQSFSTRQDIFATEDDDEAEDVDEAAAIAQCSAAFQQRLSHTRALSHKSASLRRISGGNSRKRRSLKASDPVHNNNNGYNRHPSFSARQEIFAAGDDDEADDADEAAAIAQCSAAFQQRPSHTRALSHRSASLRRMSSGGTSRKRRSLNASEIADNHFYDEEYEYSTTAQSTAETEDEISARSIYSGTDTEERPRKRLSHTSATSSKSSLGPLDPDRPMRGVRRRAAFRVSNFEIEASTAQAKRLQLLRKDRYETRRTKASDGRHHPRRSLSYTTGLNMGNIISSSMPEEAEEEAIDLMRLSKSRFERRVLSLPDPTAVSRLSQTSLNEDVDFSDGHNCQSALSATLVAASMVLRRASVGRLSSASYARRCSVMPSIGDHLEDVDFDEDNLEEESLGKYDESEPMGSTFNVPPSIFCHSEVPSRPLSASLPSNIENSYAQSIAYNSSTNHERPRPGRRMALHSGGESSLGADDTLTHPFREEAASDPTLSHELRNIDQLMWNHHEISQQHPPSQTQTLLLNSHLNHQHLHQANQRYGGHPENLPGGGSLSLYSSEHNQSVSSLKDMATGARLSSVFQGLQTTTNDQCITGESFPSIFFPGQISSGPTHDEVRLVHEPIAAAAAAVTESVRLANSLNQRAETLLAHHASATMIQPEIIPGEVPVLNESEVMTTLFDHQEQQGYLDHGPSTGLNGDVSSSIYESFDGKTTGVLGVKPSTNQEENAIRIIQKAIELDDPQIRPYVQDFRPSTRLILNNPNNSNDVALHSAVRCGSFMALETILNADKDSALIRNSEGHVPLHIAVESGNFAAVTSICNKSPTSAQVQCEEGCLALHEAVSSGADKQDAPQITAMILSAFPEAVHVMTDEGLLPIHLAAMSGFSAGLRTIFAYNHETVYSRESTEMMLPLDFAVDGLNSKKGDAPDAYLLSVAHQQPSSSQQETDLKNFESCIEMLLASCLYNRPVLSPRDESSGISFLPLHGALAAHPLQRTWKCLISLYGKDHITDIDEFGRNIAHYLCSKMTEDDEHSFSMLKEIQAESDLFAQADECGFLPLHLCLLNKKSPSFELVKAVVGCYPSAVTVEVQGKSFEVQGKSYRGFLPFQVAATSGCDENVITYLLQNHPIVCSK